MSKRVLVIPDLHAPFQHKKALYHCLKMRDLHKCEKVINIGDFADHHQLSRFTSEPDAYGTLEEFKLTLRELKKWYKAFPKMDLVLGNHDAIPKRQAKEVGIPKKFLRNLEEVYQMPSSWKIHKKYIYDDVLYVHKGKGGAVGALNYALKMSMSCSVGHIHQFGGCLYSSNPIKIFFGLNVGCLINKKAYAMRYSDSEPTLGCGVVYSSSEAYFAPLKLL